MKKESFFAVRPTNSISLYSDELYIGINLLNCEVAVDVFDDKCLYFRYENCTECLTLVTELVQCADAQSALALFEDLTPFKTIFY